MVERQNYLFLFRLPGGEIAKVKHACRSGDADITARRIARLVGKKHGTDEVVFVWAGSADAGIPPKIRKELGA